MRLAELVEFYEHLTPQSLLRLGEHYAAHARFQDPFNDVQGVEAIEAIFRHMFVQTLEPRFEVTDRYEGDASAVLVWNFHFRMRSWRPDRPQVIRGLSHLRFDADGRVTDHRDHWDSVEELYMKLPLLGGLMRALRRVLAAPRPQHGPGAA